MNEFLARLWWGPLRRPLEAVIRRVQPYLSHILSGPLRGYRFTGGLAQLLGVYEIEIQRVMVQHVHPGAVVYDIGANNGFITMLAAHLVSSSGFVYAFEPLPANLSSLRELLIANGISNCQVVPKAVADTAENLTLFFGSSSATASLRPIQEATATVTVPSVTLDTFVAEHRTPDFVKIDVEGAEGEVLRGAQRLLERAPAPIWLIEVHSAASESDTVNQLQSRQYSIHPVPSPRARPGNYPRHILAIKA